MKNYCTIVLIKLIVLRGFELNMSTETTSNKYHIKKLDNEGHNYSTWAVHCQTVLEDLDIWSVVNPELTATTPPIPPPSSTSGKSPSTEPSNPANAEWHKKNKKAHTVILLFIEDTPIQIVKEKHLAKDIWKKLSECYTGVGAHDVSILMSHLHRFQLDDSKSLESQLNQMCKMHSQLSNLGDVISDTKFAIIISNALPSSYDILKTLAVSTVSDMSQLASETLVEQVLREEKRKANQDSASTLFAKQGKTPEKSSSSKHPQKSKKGKNHPHCTNLKCKKISHTIEKCWAEGGGSEGQHPEKTLGTQSRSGQTRKDPKKKDGKTNLLLAQEYAAVAKSDCVHSMEWIINSGASSHICAN